MSAARARERRSRTTSRPSRYRAVLWLVAAIAVAVGVFHGAIEGAAVRGYVKATTGFDLDFSAIALGTGGARMTNVRVSGDGGQALASADRLDARINYLAVLSGASRLFGITSLDMRRPTITLERREDGSFAGVTDRLPHDVRLAPGFSVRVVDGTIAYRRNAPAESASNEEDASANAITGDLRVRDNGTLNYTAHFAVNADDRYGVDLATSDDAGVTTHRMTARAIPLAALGALRPPGSTVAAIAGTLEDIDLHSTSDETSTHQPTRWLGDARIAGGLFKDGPNVTISGAHGRLAIHDDGIATPKLEAMLGTTPLHVAGVLRDARQSGFRWATAGSPDAVRFARLFEKVVAQPSLQDVRVEALAPGVDFAQVATHIKAGPVVYTVMSVDQHDPTIRLGTALAQDKIVSGGERTSMIAQRVGALAGVNGDYYDIGRTYAPQGIVVRDGVLLRTPIERYALTVHPDRTVSFDMYRFSGTVRTPHARFKLTQINDWPARNVTLITPEFGGVTPVPSMTFVALAKLSPHRYRVTAIPPDGVKTEPTYGLLFGDESAKNGKPPRVGDVVEVTYDTEPSLRNVAAAVGGGPLLVKDGAWFEDPHAPAPDERDVHWSVVGVGKLADQSLVFMEVDGRHPLRSIGMTRPEFAQLMIDYNVTDGFALDSGGSATLVARPPFQKDIAVRTVPSDDSGERWISDGFFVFSDAPRADVVAQ